MRPGVQLGEFRFAAEQRGEVRLPIQQVFDALRIRAAAEIGNTQTVFAGAFVDMKLLTVLLDMQAAYPVLQGLQEILGCVGTVADQAA